MWRFRYQENWGTRLPRHNHDFYFDAKPSEYRMLEVPGILYNLKNRGYPAGKALGEDIPDRIVCEKVEILEEQLAGFDRYEGYIPDAPQHSLYIRKPYLDGWIYEYNLPVDPLLKIQSGDWLSQRR